MRWARVDGLPISINGALSSLSSLAQFDPGAVAQSIERRAVPLLWVRPYALVAAGTGVLIDLHPDVLLVTAAHVIDLVGRLGDLGVPLAASQEVIRLGAARRLAIDRVTDLAVVLLPASAETARLRRSWAAMPAARRSDSETACADHAIVAVSGYPAERTRWHEGVLHAKPLTFFVRTLCEAANEAGAGAADGGQKGSGAGALPNVDALLGFGHIGRRLDGLDIYTPALEGVSGAIAWSLHPEFHPESGSATNAESDRLRARPLGVQVSYCHSRYVRCRPWRDVLRLIDDVLPSPAYLTSPSSHRMRWPESNS